MSDDPEVTDRLILQTTEDLRSAWPDLVAVAKVVADYIAASDENHLSKGECIDYLLVDTPNICDEAGVPGSDQSRVADLFDELWLKKHL